MDEEKWMPSEAQWSKFFEDLSLTYEDDSSASTNKQTSFDKMFVVARYYSWNDRVQCGLYYIDLPSTCKDYDNSFRSLQPILQFRSVLGNFIYHTYVVVGCKLFMFGDWGGQHGQEKTWSYYDFSRDLWSSTTINVDENSLESGPTMKSGKTEPVAAVVSGYKICVFATIIYKGYLPYDPSNFEVFNTKEWSWTELPELLDYSKYGLNEIHIRSYCIESSCLIICTDIGIYGINIDDEYPKWVVIEGSERFRRSPLSGRWMRKAEGEISPLIGGWVMVGKNFCRPFEVARWGEKQSYPLAFTNNLIPPVEGLLCSERVDNGVLLCCVQGKVMNDGVPVLSVNVVKFDSKLLANLGGDMWKAIQSDKSCSFEIKSQKCDFVEIVGCYQFKVRILY